MNRYLIILQSSVKNKKEFSVFAYDFDIEEKAKKLKKKYFSKEDFVAISIYKFEKMICCENEDYENVD